MASATTGDSNYDLNWRGGCRWTANRKVYTRKIRKKAEQTSNNSDSTIATTSAAENATSGSAGNPTTTTTTPPTKVSSSTVASTVTARVTTANSSKEPKDPADASNPLATAGYCAESFEPHAIVSNDVMQECQEALVTKDADSCRQRVQEESLYQERSPSHNLADKNINYYLQEPELQTYLQRELSVPSLSENNGSTQHQAQEGSGSHNAELHNLQYSSQHNCKEPQNTRSSESGLPKGREVAAVQCHFGNELQNDGELMPVLPQVSMGNGPASTNGVVNPLAISIVDDSVRFKLAKATRKDEIKEFRKKLECELDRVRRLVNQFEAKELQLASYNSKISNNKFSNSSNYTVNEVGSIGGHSYPQLQPARIDLTGRRMLVRVSSGMGVMGHQEIRPMGLARVNSDVGTARNLEPRPYSRQLSVAVMENNHRVGEIVEKEERAPKANQYYRNSEFLLGKDRLPCESVKQLKPNNGRNHIGETEHTFRLGFGFDKNRAQVFRSCGSLLQRLMKHKHGWVFNEPVNAKALGLVDYHDIIKHPMDLGTIKTRLSQNLYDSPRDFAEDVRLVFRNAMTYNPKAQDVHIMAEQLLQIFEERWTTIETEYSPYRKYQMYQDAGLPTPNSRMARHTHFAAASVSVFPTTSAAGFVHAAVLAPAYVPAAVAPLMRTSDEPETRTPMAVDPKGQQAHVGRTPVQKKPKAKDPNKRDMTYGEKQRLTTNLQSLPAIKLDSISQIIKKRSTALSQNDDEIEVDIDNVDVETLWELDRFVTNYKKSLSKNKRRAELVLHARSAVNQMVALTNSTIAAADVRTESGTAFEKSTASLAVDSEKQVYNGRSSSSSSDSGSSSSDSDSDSSSENGSDAGHSPGT